MIELALVGIGTGNPEHLTLQAMRTLSAADLVMIPRKGPDKSDLAELRRTICAEVLRDSTAQVAEFDLPVRDPTTPDYWRRVADWHDEIAGVWARTMAEHPRARRVALLVWGDPSL